MDLEPNKINVTNKEKVKSINHALKTLNEAANESAEEIRGMLRKDYSRLTEVFSDVKPQVESSFREMRDEVVTTAKQTVDKVDETVHGRDV